MRSYTATRILAKAIIAIVTLLAVGCSSGYRIYQTHGVETFCHIDQSGSKNIVFAVDADGILKIHDKDDPVIRRFLNDHKSNSQIQRYLDQIHTDKEVSLEPTMAAKLVRIGRIKAAKKRKDSDPIFVAVHDAEMGPRITRFTRGVKHTQQRFKRIVTAELSNDSILHLAPESADVEVFFKSYFSETPALNIETHKLVTVTAFHFEAHVRSNYLPEDSYAIKELGHWMESSEIIRRTAKRINKVVSETIGPNIPKDRNKFLRSISQGV